MDDLVPPQWREEAESVRAHLVMLRGGAPFLSSSDAWRLVRWLEQGVEVQSVLLALERAAAFRHRQRLAGKPTRLPLSLGTASRHMGKSEPGIPLAKSEKNPPQPGPEPAQEPAGYGAVHPLTPLAEALVGAATAGDPMADALQSLSRDLLALDPGSDLVEAGAALFRDFLETAWSCLDPATRQEWIRQALPPDDEIDDDDQAMRDAEEHARGRLRQAYPILTTATLCTLVSP